MNREPDYYSILELSPAATDAEIKRRYRRLMREVHPDANVDDPLANRKAARINDAFETLGNAEKRREYDAARHGAKPTNRQYAMWAEADDWEDIVAEYAAPPRPAHKHAPQPAIEPDEIEVDMSELRDAPRVRRRIAVTNNCDCTLTGDVSTSEPWLWGPIGRFTIGPRETITFDIEVVARKVRFPGISRVLFVTNDWTGIVPVKITGYEPKRRHVTPSADMSYVRSRPRRWSKYR